jgi:predicted nucleic acid-binding protein
MTSRVTDEGGAGGRGAPGPAQAAGTVSGVLRLLVDTSVWLDLARRRDGQKWIAPLTGLVEEGDVELLTPEVLLAEYTRNRGRVEAAMSSGVAERFKLLRRDIVSYGGEDRDEALSFIDGLAHQVPLIGAMTTLNFKLILELLQKGRRVEPGPTEHEAVVRRGLDKRAPLHRHKNSVADALLIELYASATAARGPGCRSLRLRHVEPRGLLGQRH